MDINDDLIDRVLQGQANAEEVAEFQKWLNVPANLERYAFRAELHSDLRRSLRRRDIQSSALEARPGSETRTTTSPAVFHSRQAMMLTGLAIAACLIVAFLWPAAEDAPGTVSTLAAKVVSDANGVLTKSDVRWDDSNLPTGNYELQKGLLHLQFGGGVMVYLEAPASFDAVSDELVVLHSGRLSATVPPEGIGFTVETPEARVVDFGTEFSIDVDSGSSEVHVFDGLVHVHPETVQRGDPAKSVKLHASQAVRINRTSSKPVGIELASDRFIRNFDEPRRGYARSVKRLAPLAYYRMAIRDQGLAAEPSKHSGVVLTGEGARPPHARGFLAGGSLRVQAGSTGRGGRVDSPPALTTGQFSLAVFVYLEEAVDRATVATNVSGDGGNFALSLDASGKILGQVRDTGRGWVSTMGQSHLPLGQWRHIVLTADGESLKLYEDGQMISSTNCSAMSDVNAEAMWFGTNSDGTELWNGRIDELAIFDKSLSDAEANALFRTAVEQVTSSQNNQ